MSFKIKICSQDTFYIDKPLVSKGLFIVIDLKTIFFILSAFTISTLISSHSCIASNAHSKSFSFISAKSTIKTLLFML